MRKQGDMGHRSVIASASAAGPGRPSSEPVSLSYAFLSSAMYNDLYHFNRDEIRKSRIFLGQGAASSVYKSAVYPSTQGTVRPQVVAVKQKRRRGFSFDFDVPLESWLRFAYLDVRVMSYPPLQHSKNIATVLGYFWEDVEIEGRACLSPCLVMPVAYDKAPTLEHLLATRHADNNALEVQETIHFCHGVANGLAELHDARVVHGDMKLSNVLLFERDGQLIPKLSDFSHSFVESDFFDTIFEKPQYTGTRPFAIPEVRRQWSEPFEVEIRTSSSHDGKQPWEMKDFYLCDVFGLGLLICSILNGGVEISSRAKDSLAKDGHQPDDNLIDEYVGQLCQRPLGVLTECKKSFTVYSSTSELADSPAVRTVLEMCLQDVPESRSSAADVAASINTWSKEDTVAITSQNDPTQRAVRTGYFVSTIGVPSLPGSLHEFATYLYMTGNGGNAVLVQAQIFHEASLSSKTPTQDSEVFLAGCYALGFGTGQNAQVAASHLEHAAQLGSHDSMVILDRVAEATEFEAETSLAFTGRAGTASLKYSERVKETKARLSVDGTFTASVVKKKPKARRGFRRPAATPVSSTNDTGEDTTDLASSTPVVLQDETGRAILESPENDNNTSGSEADDANALRTLEDVRAFFDSLPQDPESNPLWKTARALRGLSLLHLAVNFHGADSSLDHQRQVLSLVRAALKVEGLASLETRDRHGRTPLLTACMEGQAMAVQHLVAAGSNVKAVDVDGLSPLHWLSFFQDDEIEQIAKQLVNGGASLDTMSTHPLNLPEYCLYLQMGCTPLHFAVALRGLAAAKALLHLGANPLATAQMTIGFHTYRLSPLHFAISLHFHEIVEELVRLPGMSSEVLFKMSNAGEEEHPISIIHLVSLQLFMKSKMGPFSRWVLHGNRYEEAAELTLNAIFTTFPEKEVLMPARHWLSSIILPVNDPYVWRVFKKLGVGFKRPILDNEVGLALDPTVFSHDPPFPAGCWIIAAMKGSLAAPSSDKLMELALSGFADHQLRFDSNFLYSILEECVIRCLDGALSVLLRSSYIRNSVQDVMPVFFSEASRRDAVAVMKVIWKVYVEDNEHYENVKNEYLEVLINGMTPLHYAAKSNATAAAHYLIGKEADMDLDIGEVGTPLYVAARHRAKDCTLLLLDRNANPFCNKAFGPGYNVLHAAVARMDLVLQGNEDPSFVSSLLEVSWTLQGVTSTDLRGNTPLHYAVGCLDIATVELLLKLPDNGLSVQTAGGLTPLMAALLLQHFYDVPGSLNIDLDVHGLVDLLGTGNLSDRSWLGSDASKIAQMLVAAGSPLPAKHPETGAYDFLLGCAASVFFSAASRVDLSEEGEATQLDTLLLQAFHNFDFMKHPSPRTKLFPQIMFAHDEQQIMVFPDGLFEGAYVLLLQGPSKG